MTDHSIFISYSSRDRQTVNRIVAELDKMGASYWKAPEMIPAGSSYAREIPQAIQNCSVFLLVLSPTSQESIWVEKEIDSAICNRKTIIPFEIEKVELNDTFRFYLNNVQMISYSEDHTYAFEELKRQLVNLMPQLAAEKKTVQTKQQSGKPVDKGTGKNEETPGDPKKRILSIEGTAKVTGPRRNRNTNALRMNRIPLACQYCGCKDLENVTMGTYRCVRCGRDNYDDFQTIRNFLEKTGASSALVIERETGVPRRIIEYFFRDEYLEIPKNCSVRMQCTNCGAPIRTGTLCEACKAKANAGQKVSYKTDKWHTLW